MYTHMIVIKGYVCHILYEIILCIIIYLYVYIYLSVYIYIGIPYSVYSSFHQKVVRNQGVGKSGQVRDEFVEEVLGTHHAEEVATRSLCRRFVSSKGGPVRSVMLIVDE